MPIRVLPPPLVSKIAAGEVSSGQRRWSRNSWRMPLTLEQPISASRSLRAGDV